MGESGDGLREEIEANLEHNLEKIEWKSAFLQAAFIMEGTASELNKFARGVEDPENPPVADMLALAITARQAAEMAGDILYQFCATFAIARAEGMQALRDADS